jgi:hypothetical protein
LPNEAAAQAVDPLIDTRVIRELNPSRDNRSGSF